MEQHEAKRDGHNLAETSNLKHKANGPFMSSVGPWNAQIGRFTGKDTVPLDSTGTAGFCTVSVAPYGYTNVRASSVLDSELFLMLLPAARFISRLMTPFETTHSFGWRYL